MCISSQKGLSKKGCLHYLGIDAPEYRANLINELLYCLYRRKYRQINRLTDVLAYFFGWLLQQLLQMHDRQPD